MTENRSRYRAMARQAASVDLWLLGSVLLLCGLGLIMVMSASSVLAEGRYNDAYFLFKHQVLSLGLGLVLMILCRFLPVSLYAKLIYPILLLSLAGLILVFVPGVGLTAGGATRWLRLGSGSLQPSEPAKLALVLFLAYSMAKKKESMGSFSIGLLPHLLVAGLMICLTLLQKDLGMAVILTLLLLVMLYLGGARLSHLLGFVVAAVPLGVLMVLIAPYRVKRFVTFADPWADPLGAGYQIVHSFLAFGSGGIFGAGIGSGHQKLGYLPEPHTDFIFSVLAEEAGFIGVGLVVVLFMILAWRGFYWARQAPDYYQRYLATGLTLLISIQAMVNMAVVLGLLPTTGLTLPLMSYGGSSLVVNLIAAGILLRLSDTLRRSSV